MPRWAIILCVVLFNSGHNPTPAGDKPTRPGSVWVKPYNRKNGTRVEGHTRSAPSNNKATPAPKQLPQVNSEKKRDTPVPARVPNESQSPEFLPVVMSPGSAANRERWQANGRIAPETIGKLVLKLPGGRLVRHVEQYEEAELFGRKSEVAELLKDDLVVMFGTPVFVAMESVTDEWVYCRPTEGPHIGRLVVVRKWAFKQLTTSELAATLKPSNNPTPRHDK